MSVKLIVLILTYNEEPNLPACLNSLSGLPCSVIVVDSCSTDRTADIARRAGATVLVHPFETHASQWQWAIHNLPQSPDWVLGLDADQRLSPELRDNLVSLACGQYKPPTDVGGFYVARKQIFRGSWIRYGGYYPKYLLKLFRPARLRIDKWDLLDHHFYVTGRTGKLRGDLIEDNLKERDLGFWLTKHLRYATVHAREELLRRNGSSEWPVKPDILGNPDQRVIWLKQRWYRLPLYLRPCLYFAYRYVLLRGFLDGTNGFVFHFLQAFWYRLMVDISLDELLQQNTSTE